MTFISIIIPFDSYIRYLKDCLDSLDEQNIEDLETIIVINGISEEDLEKANRLIENYPELNISTKVFDDRITVSKARNEGIKLASGKYLYFIDSDDYLYLNALEKLVDVAKEMDCDFINGQRMRSYYIRERINEQMENRALKNKEFMKQNERTDMEFALKFIVMRANRTIELISALHSLIKRELVIEKNIEFEEDKRYYSDYSFIANVVKHADSFKGVEDAIYIQRQRDDYLSLSSLNQELGTLKFEYSTKEYENTRKIIESFDEGEKKEFFKREITSKIYRFYLKTFSFNYRSSKKEEWRTSYYDKMRELAVDFEPRYLKKREINALIEDDKKKYNRYLNFRLGRRKVKRILEGKNEFYRTIYLNIFNKRDINPKKIALISFRGDYYTDSPKYIYEYLNDKFKDEFEYVWVLNDKSTKVPGKVKKVKRFSLSYFYHLATSKYWITNGRQPKRLRKREEQEIISTWHGTPLKRLGLDIGNIYSGSPKIKKDYINNAKEWDYLISANRYTTEKLKSCFGYDREILETGYPRNDILYNADSEDIKRIKESLKIPSDKKIILYAPTWRDDQFYDLGQYKFDLELDISKMKEALGEEYILLVRTHYFIADKLDLGKYDGFAYDVSSHDDIAELYLISDILITDYSSVFFDFANLRRPILFFTYDLDKYENVLRGFYLDIHTEVPGPLVFTTDEIIERIENIDQLNEEFKDRYDEFYERFCSIDDGKASKRLVEHVWKN